MKLILQYMFLCKILQKANIPHTLTSQTGTHTFVVLVFCFLEKLAYVLKDDQKSTE